MVSATIAAVRMNFIAASSIMPAGGNGGHGGNGINTEARRNGEKFDQMSPFPRFSV
jgi:hypothetical protein